MNEREIVKNYLVNSGLMSTSDSLNEITKRYSLQYGSMVIIRYTKNSVPYKKEMTQFQYDCIMMQYQGK